MRTVTLSTDRTRTAQLRALVLPWLLRLPGADGLVFQPDGRVTARLHPRIASFGGLPGATRTALRALEVEVSTRDVELTPAQAAELPVVQFHSRAKRTPPPAPGLPDTWLRILSNFHPSRVVVDGALYPSLEHWFQAGKVHCAGAPEHARRFQQAADGTCPVGTAPLDAKRAGSRRGFTAHGLTLDSARWDESRLDIMRRGVRARWQQDDLFRAIVEQTTGLTLLHFERAGARSFWGGSLHRQTRQLQGDNRLGRLIMALRDAPGAGG